MRVNEILVRRILSPSHPSHQYARFWLGSLVCAMSNREICGRKHRGSNRAVLKRAIREANQPTGSLTNGKSRASQAGGVGGAGEGEAEEREIVEK